jgi:hypothetical protein
MKNVLKTLFFAVCFFGVASVAQAQTTNNNTAKTDTTKRKVKIDLKEAAKKVSADAQKAEDEKNASEVLRGTLNKTPKPTPTDKDKPKKKE